MKDLIEAIGNKQVELVEKQEEIIELQTEIDSFEIDEAEYEDHYDNLLDETNEHLFNMHPSNILKKMDPIMYNQGLSEYVDGIELSGVEEYTDLEEQLEELTEELEDLETELEELTEELKETEI
jgi:chromosome segregation ATPase